MRSYAFENTIEWLMNDTEVFITARAFVAVRQKLTLHVSACRLIERGMSTFQFGTYIKRDRIWSTTCIN